MTFVFIQQYYLSSCCYRLGIVGNTRWARVFLPRLWAPWGQEVRPTESTALWGWDVGIVKTPENLHWWPVIGKYCAMLSSENLRVVSSEMVLKYSGFEWVRIHFWWEEWRRFLRGGAIELTLEEWKRFLWRRMGWASWSWGDGLSKNEEAEKFLLAKDKHLVWLGGTFT